MFRLGRCHVSLMTFYYLTTKISKQYEDLAGVEAGPLMVGYCKPTDYVRQFEWDYAKYAPRQPLPALVHR